MTPRILAAALALTAMSVAPHAQEPRFRAATSVVTVSVSVKRGNAAVANLKAADFKLTDSGVPQTIEAITIESLPIDVTLFLDTSGSTAGKLDDMRQDVQSILQLLRSEDRFRLLTIGDAVNEVVPWVPAGTKTPVAIEPVGGISLIRDALMLALVHRPEAGRRHLIVGMTDRRDCGSVVSSSLLHEIAGRSEAVMHLVDYSGGGGDARYRVRTCSPQATPEGEIDIARAAERTGGEVHAQSRFFRASSIARAFRTIFNDFRQSYVLRYSPERVPARGWHPIVVQVPSAGNPTIRARQGYYAN